MRLPQDREPHVQHRGMIFHYAKNDLTPGPSPVLKIGKGERGACHKDLLHDINKRNVNCLKRIQLIFQDKTIEVDLRTINNEIGHCQVRYDSEKYLNLKNELKNIFQFTLHNTENNCSEYLDIEILDHNILKITPYPYIDNDFLYGSNLIYHNIENENLKNNLFFGEVIEALQNIKFEKNERQIHYNKKIKEEFIKLEWEYEKNVVEDERVTLKCDFRKANFQLEIEFGNARGYYQDLIKFMMAYNSKYIEIGGLVVLSEKFAKHLCSLGKQEAIKKYKNSQKTYSGIATFEKINREFRYIKDILNIPIFIVSIDYKNYINQHHGLF